jgi:hypothetical protein
MVLSRVGVAPPVGAVQATEAPTALSGALTVVGAPL